MRFDPFRWRDEYASLPSDAVVYTLRLKTDFDGETIDLLCDCAWTTDAERQSHFWLTDNAHQPVPAVVEKVETTAGEFVRMHLAEVSPMNPFYSLGRAEFLAKWNPTHPRAIGV